MLREDCSIRLGLLAALFAAGCSTVADSDRGAPASGQAPPSAQAAQAGGDGRSEDIEVAAHKVPCQGEAAGFCLLARTGEGQPWRIQQHIAGFDHQWGLQARLRVTLQQVPDPAADDSSRAYALERVLAAPAPPASSEFELVFLGGLATPLITGPSDGMSLRGERALTCADPALCRLLDQRRAGGSDLRLTLRHPARRGDPLVVIGLAEAL